MRLSVLTGDPTAAGHARLVRNHARGLLGHEGLGRLEQDRARADELELVLLAGGATDPRHRT